MKRIFVAIGALAVGVLMLPEAAAAQRRGWGGAARSFGGVSAFRGPGVAVRSGFGYGYRGVGYSGRRWAYGGYRPYYGYRRSYGYGGALAAGLIGGLALGSSYGYYGAPYEAGYAYTYPPYGYATDGGVAYETYPPGLTQPCVPGRGCRADGYPDARYYNGTVGYGY